MGDIRAMARGPMPVHLRDWVEDQIYNISGDGNRHAMRRLAADMDVMTADEWHQQRHQERRHREHAVGSQRVFAQEATP